ncbi:ABC transporter ATP-binding protein [Merismopedia glauca]|uniref:ABC transporter ATP-binding protein n=1 Tax=Merismopedia glauca CCAP 1448/3 TaxID=1296344 RepID=A0A2T1C7K8_9CYAN|nr:ABC transporter ATP-binding protein [Merismopedia glauca]PSB04133.1 ABC transporter ATP-binding protein [Merismopedia glauca CCAP 1448/3]
MSVEPNCDRETNSEVILSVKDVSKKYCRSLKKAYLYGLKDIGCELVGKSRDSHNLRNGEFWALKDISLELKRGESIGFVGINGSGKSTLIKIIGGLLKPDIGSIKVRGRVATLNVLGAGFNPLLSGRENVYINMSILGLSKQEIDENYEQVLDFAEIWDAIDSPVRTYSSGMKARLGFACAIHSHPDILLIDEVLAVGDAKFRTKCYRKLAELRQAGTSFVMVSHSANVILKTCDYAIYLRKGKIVISGEASLVMKEYEEDLSGKIVSQSPGILTLAEKTETEDLSITSVCFQNQNGQILQTLISGNPACLSIQCKANSKIENVGLGVLIKELKEDGDWTLNLSSDSDGQILEISPEESELQLEFPYCGLKPGVYVMKITIFKHPFYVYDIVESFKFEVTAKQAMSQCLYYQPHSWKVINRSLLKIDN